MLRTLRAELKKLLTVRSTYFISLFVLVLSAFIATYVVGYQESLTPAASDTFLRDSVYMVLGTFATFAVIASILLIAHEYRYNTIAYTLTAANHRWQVLLAKTIVLLGYGIVGGLVVSLIGYFGALWGASLAGHTVAQQTFEFGDILWRYAAYIVGYVLFGIIIVTIVRSLVGSIVVFFLLPTLEQILVLLLKTKADYLPFKALEAIGTSGVQGMGTTSLTHVAALGVVALYVLVVGGLATYLFVKRDAN